MSNRMVCGVLVEDTEEIKQLKDENNRLLNIIYKLQDDIVGLKSKNNTYEVKDYPAYLDSPK